MRDGRSSSDVRGSILGGGSTRHTAPGAVRPAGFRCGSGSTARVVLALRVPSGRGDPGRREVRGEDFWLNLARNRGRLVRSTTTGRCGDPSGGVGALREHRLDELRPPGKRRAHQPADALEQLRRLPGRREQTFPDLVRLGAGERGSIALGHPRRARGRERLQRGANGRPGRQLSQASHHVARGQTSLELDLRCQRLVDVPAQRGRLPGGKERLDQGAALGLVRVDGGPQRLGGIHPPGEEPGLVGPRLGSELLEPQRLRPRRATIRLTALDQLCRPAKPCSLDIRRSEGFRGGAQTIGKTVRRSEEGPRGPR